MELPYACKCLKWSTEYVNFRNKVGGSLSMTLTPLSRWSRSAFAVRELNRVSRYHPILCAAAEHLFGAGEAGATGNCLLISRATMLETRSLPSPTISRDYRNDSHGEPGARWCGRRSLFVAAFLRFIACLAIALYWREISCLPNLPGIWLTWTT